MSLTQKSRGNAKNIFIRELFGLLQEVVTSRDRIWSSGCEGKHCLAWRWAPDPGGRHSSWVFSCSGLLVVSLLKCHIPVISGSSGDTRNWDLWNVIGQRTALGKNDSLVFLSFLVWWPRSQQCWILSSRREVGADAKWVWATVQGAWLMATKQRRRAWVQTPASAPPDHISCNLWVPPLPLCTVAEWVPTQRAAVEAQRESV